MQKIVFLALCLAGLTATAQDPTLPPATQHAVLTVHGRGVQIYTCKAGQWVFVAPAARLFDASGIEVGSHGDGPVWHLLDGSSVLGKVIAKSPSADQESIPWLLLKPDRTGGAGKLAGVEFIRRSETKVGLLPAAGVTLGNLRACRTRRHIRFIRRGDSRLQSLMLHPARR